jgi:uncharacterized protein YhfF
MGESPRPRRAALPPSALLPDRLGNVTLLVIDRVPTQVVCVRTADEPAAMTRGWTQLEALTGTRGRRFYGVFDAGSGEYRVSAQVREGDDSVALGLESRVLPGGRYLRARLRGEPPASYERIAPTFAALEKLVTADLARPYLEFYRRHNVIELFLPIVDAQRTVERMWAAFVAAATIDPATPYSVWHFGYDEALADSLAELVRSGPKRATAGSLWSYELEQEPFPKIGELSVVTDWAGRARCVIRTTSVEIVAFEAVTAEHAAAEGEGDRSLEYWRTSHWAYFTRELRAAGREPSPDMLIVCERFELVFGGEPGAAAAG